MSLKIMTAVWAVDLPHADKIVLLALADNANDDGSCFPSIGTLCTKCSLSERSVFRALVKLETEGHITRQQRAGRSTVYLIHPCQSGTPDTPSPLTPVAGESCHVGTPAPATLAPTPASVAPITIIEPSIEPSPNHHPEARAAVQSVFDHWKRAWKHPSSKLDAKRRKRIEARLKDFTADQLCDAISGFRHSAWHTGTDPKGNGTIYDSIDTLLRDSAQVEKGIALFTHPPRPPPKAETAHDRMQRLLNGDNSRVIEHDDESRLPAISGR